MIKNLIIACRCEVKRYFNRLDSYNEFEKTFLKSFEMSDKTLF